MFRLFRSGLFFFLCGVWGVAQAQPPAGSSSADEQKLLQALNDDALKATTPKPSVRPVASQTMNPDMSFILDVAGAWFSDEQTDQLGAHDPKSNGFTFQQLELAVTSTVDPYFKFNANLVFSLQGVELEEAYATSLALPGGLQVRLGQFLFPFGRLNPVHPHAWNFVDRSLVIGKFLGSESGRGLGLELSWLVPLPWYSKLTTAISQPAGECCSASYAGEINPPVSGFEDLLYTTRWEHFFELSSSWAVLAGGSVMVGENKRGLGNLTVLTGGDLTIRYRPENSPLRRGMKIQAEWIQRQQQVAGDVLIDHGGHVDLVVELSPEWTTAYRWQLVSGIDDDLQFPDWTSNRQRHSAQVSWYPSHFTRIRLQGNFDRSQWLSDPVYSVMTAFEVVVGAHGAHSY